MGRRPPTPEAMDVKGSYIGRFTHKDPFFDNILGERDKLHQQAIDALQHLPRDHAMSIILSYIDMGRLKEIMSTSVGADPPATDRIEAFTIKLGTVLRRFGLDIAIVRTRNTPENAGLKPATAFKRALKEVIF